MSTTAALFAAVLNQPIPYDTWVSAWSLSELYQWAGEGPVMLIYGLEHTFIVIPDEPPVPAIGIANVLLWLDIDAFLLSGGGVCTDGCDVPSYLI